jgi:hypothetical protein
MEFNNKLKPIRAKQNKGIYQGKPFWIGVANLQDGIIEETYPYETAEANDFHHSFYMSPSAIERLENKEAGVFWFNTKTGNIETEWHQNSSGLTPALIELIKKQLGK